MTYQTPHNITVEVETQYVEAQSEPDSERYVFSYTITIRNEGEIPAQLIATPVGSMHGTYQMVADTGEEFDAEIPAFTLAIPRTLH
jgi:ApaG protein